MSTAVISTSAAQGRFFIFDDESAPEVSVDVGTAAPERGPHTARLSRDGVVGCPVEQSSTAVHPAYQLPGVARHDSRGRLPLHEYLQSAITNQRFPSASIAPASQFAIRPMPEMVSSSIAALDAMTAGLPRGCITEICGPASSGRTSVMLAALAAATGRGECCALVDASDALDPLSVAAAGVDPDRLLWVRCGESSAQKNIPPRRHRDTETSFSSVDQRLNSESRKINRANEHCLEQVLRATDLLLESGGFGLIVLDLADVAPESARRIPLTTWFRFRRAIEHTPTILLVIEPQPIIGSCSSLLLQLGVPGTPHSAPSSKLSHSHLLTGLEITVELIRSRQDRKPVHSATFETRTAWAGG